MRRMGMFAAVMALSCAAPLEPGDDGGTGIETLDAGHVLDAGAPAVDAGPPAVDAGPPPAPDAGVPPPPYPIVLAHGFFGFQDFAGIDFINYFHGVKEHLAEAGETQVFTPAVDPFNDSDVRGAELLAHVERIVAETGAGKVNLIGHSQGGLDARWVAHERPDLVASVTTFATPHGGTSIGDIVLGLVSEPAFQDVADALVRLIGAVLWDAAGDETSVLAALRLFSRPGIEEFNARVTNGAGVSYYSVAGRSDFALDVGPCSVRNPLPMITRYHRTLDPVDPLLSLSESLLDGTFGTEANDGLVQVTNARWGRFLGCVPADHLDEIGQLLGDGPGFGNDFDHRTFYADLVAFLRSEGL